MCTMLQTSQMPEVLSTKCPWNCPLYQWLRGKVIQVQIRLILLCHFGIIKYRELYTRVTKPFVKFLRNIYQQIFFHFKN